jgi:DNA-directed RNA polymerase subunit RPC12/RpoP
VPRLRIFLSSLQEAFFRKIQKFLGGAVTKIFWVTCPQCKGEFYCHYQELRHKKIKLLCPYCNHQFFDEESAKIVE